MPNAIVKRVLCWAHPDDRDVETDSVRYVKICDMTDAELSRNIDYISGKIAAIKMITGELPVLQLVLQYMKDELEEREDAPQLSLDPDEP